MIKHSLIILSLLAGGAAHAQVAIDPDAVTHESVYPDYGKVPVIQNKNVPLQWRTQLALFAGMRRNDPYFDSTSVSGALTFHFTEQHALQVYSAHFSNKQSDTSTSVEAATPVVGGVQNLNLAPSPESLTLVAYKLLPYYGKISFAKNEVFNLNLYGTIGTGKINYPGKSFPVQSIGLGQDLYFNKYLGMSLDIRGLYYKGPDATSKNLTAATSKPAVDTFDRIQTFNLLLNVGIVGVF